MSSSAPFSYTDPPSTAPSSNPYAEIESASNVHLIVTDSDTNGRSASVVFRGDNSSSRTASKLVLTSLVLSVLCIFCVLALMGFCVFVLNDGHLLPRASGSEGGEDREEVCMPCVQIGPNPLDSSVSWLWMDQLDVRYEVDDVDNATEICCASSSAQFAVLFKLILQRQQAVKELADSLEKETKKDCNDAQKDHGSGEVSVVGLSAVSAHLVFKPKQTQTSDLSEQQWKSPKESPMSHVHETGLSFKDKRLVVKTPGLYYVYCQLLYNPAHSDVTSSGPDLASAYVRRYSILRPAAPDFLLKSRHTRHDLQHDRHSSYVGGVFRLHSGDSLYVQVSRPDLISHDDVSSFFGLFRIGD